MKEYTPSKTELKQMLRFNTTFYDAGVRKEISKLEREIDKRTDALSRKDKECQRIRRIVKSKREKQQREIKEITQTKRDLERELSVEGPSKELGRRIQKLVKRYEDFVA